MINHTRELSNFGETRNNAKPTNDNNRTMETTTSAKVSNSNLSEYCWNGLKIKVIAIKITNRRVMPIT
jgi:hypothetical protein